MPVACFGALLALALTTIPRPRSPGRPARLSGWSDRATRSRHPADGCDSLLVYCCTQRRNHAVSATADDRQWNFCLLPKLPSALVRMHVAHCTPGRQNDSTGGARETQMLEIRLCWDDRLAVACDRLGVRAAASRGRSLGAWLAAKVGASDLVLSVWVWLRFPVATAFLIVFSALVYSTLPNGRDSAC